MKSVLVLMSTYNGEKYIREQIDSILLQEKVKVTLKVRDDGSTDGTLDILNEYQQKGLLSWYTGENKRSAYSFMDLIFTADMDYDYYALSDQDDVWLKNKLWCAVEKFKCDTDKPALYFSLQTYVDENLNLLNDQVEFGNKAYTFAQAFMKNMAAGCTMVMNRSLINILKLHKPEKISMHDRWIYLVCSGINGEIYYDKNSYILYRQHSNNVTGKKTKLELIKARVNRLLGKDQYAYIHAVELKKGMFKFLSNSNCRVVDNLINYRKSWINKWKLIIDKEFRIEGCTLTNYSFIIKILLNNI